MLNTLIPTTVVESLRKDCISQSDLSWFREPRTWMDLISEGPPQAMLLLCSASCFPVSLLEFASGSSREDIRYAIMYHPHCSVRLLLKFSEDESKDIRWLVVKHDNCFVDILTKMFWKENDLDILQAIADHPLCPPEILSNLGKNEDKCIRSTVANHPNCPPEVLAILAEDKNEDVRHFVARNIYCPVDLLYKLETDSNSDVRFAVATSPSCPYTILKRLEDKDENEDVREVAQEIMKRNALEGIDF